MVARMFAGLVILPLLALGGAALDAQGVVGIVGTTPVTPGAAAVQPQSASKPGSPGATSITARFDHTTVEDALHEIARQAGYRLVYERTRTQLTGRITANLKGMPVSNVLAVVLKGTGATARMAPDGVTILIVPRGRVVGGKAQGVISGVVSDAKTSKPISGASVSIGVVSDKGVTTGEDGTYRLMGIANGTHTVTVRILGYAKQTRQVTVAEEATVSADFSLEPSASVLDQVVVTGSVASVERRAVPTAMSVITAKDIQEKGITRIDQLFRGELPGVFSQNGMSDLEPQGTQMFVRGTSKIDPNNPGIQGNITSSVKVYIDGIEMANERYINLIDTKNIERIEFIAGPQASTIYGSGAINGVMQVFTKKGQNNGRPEITLSLQSGLAENNYTSSLTPKHDHSVQLAGGSSEVSYIVGGGYLSIGNWLPKAASNTWSGYGSLRRQEGPVTAEASTRMSRRLLPSNAVSYSFYLPQEQGIYNTRFASDLVPKDAKEFFNSRTLGLNISGDLKPWWQQRFTIGVDEIGRRSYEKSWATPINPRDTVGITNDNRTLKQTLAYSTTISGSFGSLLSGNLTGGADRTTNENNISSASANGATKTFVGTLAPNLIRRSTEQSKGFYTQGQLSIGDAVFFTSGIRFDKNSNYGKSYGWNVAPRYGVSVSRSFGPLTGKLRGAYGTATRPPAASQRDDFFSTSSNYGTYRQVIGNPNLAPERQKGGEGGVELYLGNRVSLQITSYSQTVEDGIISAVQDSVAPLPGATTTVYARVTQWQNVGTIHNRGLEGQGEVKLLQRLSLGGTWSYTRSRVTRLNSDYVCADRIGGFLGFCFFPGQAFNGITEHTGSARLTYSDSRSTAGLYLSFIGQQNTTSNDADMNPYNGDLARLRGVDRTTRFDFAGAAVTYSGYYTANFQASRKLGRISTLFLQVDNLTNSYETDIQGHGGLNVELPVIGRQMSLGLRLVK